jgi:3-oxoacyl-[acyl-carrier protein] reductase
MKNLLITGAGKGLGLEIIRMAALDSGYRIFAVARDISNIESVECCQGTEIVGISCDLGIEMQVRDLVDRIKEYDGILDGMILNAGVFLRTPLESSSWTDLERLMRVNCYSCFSLSAGLSEKMSSGSHIILVSSMGGFQGSSKFAGNTGYCMSKGAMTTLGECLSSEYAGRNIAVNVVCPGAVRTSMLSQAFPEYEGGVSPKYMGTWLWAFYKEGRSLFNGRVIPISTQNP